MSTRYDPIQVLKHLARTLDVDETIEAFPGLSREIFVDILNTVTTSGVNIQTSAILSVDGAARGNPGPAGAGIVLQTGDGRVYRIGEYLGTTTNNIAEYKALLTGVRKAGELGVSELQVRSDSELVVKQLNGLYKVKNPQLQELYFSVIKTITSFKKITFTHVPREENKEADRMANLAIDAEGKVEL